MAATTPIAIAPNQGLGILKTGSKNQSLDIFKQEIDADGNPLTTLEPVAKELQNYSFKDYNISNHRRYKYFIYLSQKYPVKNDENQVVIYKTDFTV